MSSTSKPLQNYRNCQKNDENNIQMTTVETLYKLQSCGSLQALKVIGL